jgi:hypothetical protein
VTRNDYSLTPLAKKLGIEAGATVAFLGAPDGFEASLAPLPDGVRIAPRARRDLDVMLLFARRASDLRHRFEALVRRLATDGGLWIAWPKKATGVGTDLTFEGVQRVGLESGLVDNKSCSIDEVWQALRFVVRRQDRPRRASAAR